MTTQDLQKIRIIPNRNYRRSGTKSYVWLLNKWGFEPTMPGPYFQMSRVSQAGHQGLLSQMGGRAEMHRVLAKKTGPGEGQTGEITAEDQQNDAMYLCEVEIGTPPQKALLDFDTGSSDLWLWSTELPASIKSQGTGHNIFDPSKSSTFKKQSGAKWKISYGDQSSASGDVGTDNVTIGGLVIKNQAVELAKQMSQQFVEGTGDGLLGLAWGPINTVTPKRVQTPVENMITEQDIPKSAELFTAYLGSWRDANDPNKGESFYTFGYIDQPTVEKSGEQISWTPVENSEGFWTVASESATVNGQTVSQAGNTAIMDTGTTLALVSDTVCQAIYKAIPGATYDQASQGYIFPDKLTADQFPTVTIGIGGKEFMVQKEDLGFAEAKQGFIYGGIQSRGTMTFDILGDTMLKSIYAIFDQGNKRFGAVPRIQATQNTQPPPQDQYQ